MYGHTNAARYISILVIQLCNGSELLRNDLIVQNNPDERCL